MKNEVILWLSSLIILFLIGYIKSVTDKDYPITGTFGIEGKKVSYKLDKISFDKTSYSNIIISDIKGINAKFVILNNEGQIEIPYKEIEKGLECEIQKLDPGKIVNYKVVVSYKNKIFEIPSKKFVTLRFWGNIPSPVNLLYLILLYSGLLMSLRCLLELFNNNSGLKKYAFITSILFIMLNIIIYPLYNTYKLGAINHYVPPFGDLVEPLLLIILFLWFIGTILLFKNIKIRFVTILISSATILIFFFL